jgi:hypothetical protein
MTKENEELKSQLFQHLKELQLEYSQQMSRSNYSVDKFLSKEIEKMWMVINELKNNE